MDGVLLWLKPLLEGYAGQYGWLVSVLTVVGSLRLFLKPLMSIVQNVVYLTPNKKDDEFVNKILEAKWYKMLSYLLDWFGSIKLPQAPKK